MNYFQNGRGDGTIVLVLAVVSAVLALARRFPLLWFTGGASLGIVVYTFINFQTKIGEIETNLQGNRFAGLLQSVQLHWGIAILVIGALLVIAAAAMPVNKSAS